MKLLNHYYVVYQKFIKICLLALLGSYTNAIDEDQFGNDLKDFLLEKYPETELEDLKSKIDNIEIENIIKGTRGNKISKFNLQLYAFVYYSMIDFPPSNFIYDTITTNNFFRNLHRLIKVKIHLHHSHTTGKILGYVHDFCNWVVRENKTEFAMIAYNLFGFDMFFFIKGYQATAWGIKDLNFGGTYLTHRNYGNITSEVKLIDTLKYYQKRLAELASTLSEDEKNSAKYLTKQFFDQHTYFSEVWKYLSDPQKVKF